MARTQTRVGEVAAALIAEMPDQPTRTLARSLHQNHPKLFPTVERARDIVRRLRGNHGERHRKLTSNKSNYRPNGVAGYVAKMPKPHVEKWEPFVLDGVKNVLCLSDIHVPYHDVAAIEAAIKCGKKHKIDCLLINGDLIDFYQISRYIKDPERRDVDTELTQTAELLLYLRHHFPEARFVYKEGNHDERWSHYIWNNAPVLWKVAKVRLDSMLAMKIGDLLNGGRDDLPVYHKLEEYGIEYVNDQRPVMCGQLPILHGHELAKGIAAPVNAARGAFMKTMHTVLIGHGHRSSNHVEPDMFGREVATWSQGCLCGLHPGFARTNKWNHGWSVVEVANDGEFNLLNYRMNREGKVRTS